MSEFTTYITALMACVMSATMTSGSYSNSKFRVLAQQSMNIIICYHLMRVICLIYCDLIFKLFISISLL
ncbi:hypothetical protein HanIR_Chr05g0227791 [Helianthus annuus]|nr:hypothetical protein HanIR_Chr05g0227791 [Helianthus annuus]